MAATIVTCPHCGKRNRIQATAQGVPQCANCGHKLPWLVDADSESFGTETMASVPVVVDFWAPWCGPCRAVEAILAELERDHEPELAFVKLNIDENIETASRYSVLSIPTTILFEGGSPQETVIGARPRAHYERAWAPWLRLATP
jgi:thioredoxin 2